MNRYPHYELSLAEIDLLEVLADKSWSLSELGRLDIHYWTDSLTSLLTRKLVVPIPHFAYRITPLGRTILKQEKELRGLT